MLSNLLRFGEIKVGDVMVPRTDIVAVEESTSFRDLIARFREALERREKRTIGEAVAASRWRQEVFEPTIVAVPEKLWAALPAAEVFHQVLEHRWFLSEQAGKDVGIDEAVRHRRRRGCDGRLPRPPLSGDDLMHIDDLRLHRYA